MADKTRQQDNATGDAGDPLTALQRQTAGVGAAWAAWFEAMGDLGADVATFLAKRIEEDVKTQHQILHSTSLSEVQRIQAEFVERAVVQYQAETGKLLELGSKVLAPKDDTA